jgi:hypothetical protein
LAGLSLSLTADSLGTSFQDGVKRILMACRIGHIHGHLQCRLIGLWHLAENWLEKLENEI